MEPVADSPSILSTFFQVDKKPAADPAPSSANNHVATDAQSTTSASYPANSHTSTGDALPNHIQLGNPTTHTGIAAPSAPVDSPTVGVSEATGAPDNASTTGPVADAHAVGEKQHQTESVASSQSLIGRFAEGMGLTASK